MEYFPGLLFLKTEIGHVPCEKKREREKAITQKL